MFILFSLLFRFHINLALPFKEINSPP